MTTATGPATLDLLSPTFRVLSEEVRAAASQYCPELSGFVGPVFLPLTFTPTA